MALDPNKKRTPEELAKLRAVANPYADSMGARMMQASREKQAQHFAGLEAAKTAPKFITADSGQLPNSAFKPAGVVAPSPIAAAVAAPRPTPNVNIISPTNPASMQLTPPSRADAYPARNPASPASQAGASAPAGGVPAPQTLYNDGSGQAYRTGDGRMGALPAGVAVTRQKDGTNAFGATGASVAQASGQITAPALANPTALAAQPDMRVTLPRPAVADAYNTREANAAQTALASKIDSEMFRNSFAAGRGSRSALDLQGQMLQTLAGIGGKQLDVAANVAGGNRDTAAKYDLTGVEQVGLNKRALLSDTGDTNRTLLGEQGANSRAALSAQTELQKPSTLTDIEGNVLSVVGTNATPITAGGKPVRAAQTKAEGAITPAIQLDALTKQLAAEAGALEPNQERIGVLQQQIGALTGGNSAAQGAPSGAQVAVNPKTGERVQLNPKTGKWEPIK